MVSELGGWEGGQLSWWVFIHGRISWVGIAAGCRQRATANVPPPTCHRQRATANAPPPTCHRQRATAPPPQFSVEPVDVIYETADGQVESTETTPLLSSRTAKAQLTDVCSVIGVELDAPTVCELCTKMQLGPATYVGHDPTTPPPNHRRTHPPQHPDTDEPTHPLAHHHPGTTRRRGASA